MSYQEGVMNITKLPTGIEIPFTNTVISIGKLLAGNLLFNIIANASFKLSVTNATWRTFIFWQVVGNLAGFATVLTLTGLLVYIPLHIAFPVTTGLTIIGVQIVAAHLLFHETITPTRWLGTLFIVLGIMLIGKMEA
jgi:multidrug transporter EmrE-like cation transporter